MRKPEGQRSTEIQILRYTGSNPLDQLGMINGSLFMPLWPPNHRNLFVHLKNCFSRLQTKLLLLMEPAIAAADDVIASEEAIGAIKHTHSCGRKTLLTAALTS